MTTLQQEKVEECEKSTHPSTSTFAEESEVMRGRGNDFAEKVDRGDQGSSLYDVHRVQVQWRYINEAGPLWGVLICCHK